MDPISLGGGLVSLIGGIFGGASEAEAAGLSREQLNRILGIKEPTIEEQKLALEKYQRGEKLTPAEMSAAGVGDSAFEDISTDPRLKAAQLDALAGLQGVSDAGGMTLTDNANLQKLLGEAATADKGRRDAITQNMAERGMGGTGMELAAKLQAAQDASMQQNQAATDTAANAQARALQALQQSGDMAGAIRGQDFNQDAAKAAARDEIARFNAENRQQSNLVNTQNMMDTNRFNTERGNDVMDANTELSNQEQTYNKGLYQNQFNNALAKQELASNASKEAASGISKVGSQISGAAGTIGQGIMQYGAPGKKKKETA